MSPYLGFAGRFVGKILKIHHKKAALVIRSYVGIDTLIPVLTGKLHKKYPNNTPNKITILGFVAQKQTKSWEPVLILDLFDTFFRQRTFSGNANCGCDFFEKNTIRREQCYSRCLVLVRL
jgi:hypothetical protein